MPNEAVHSTGSGCTRLTALSSDWYWEQDSSFHFTKVARSPSADPLESFDKRLMIGQRRWEMPGARALSTTWDRHRAQLEAGKPFRDFQYLVSAGSHGPLYLSASGEPVFDARGRLVGYRGTARDITAHRISEQRLCDARALLQMAVKAGPVGSWSIDLPSLELTWSSESRTMLEVPGGDPCSMEDAINAYSPEYRGEVRSALAACIAEGKPFSLEAQIITGAQRRIWVSTTGHAEHDASGVAVRVRGALQDITESKQTSEKSLQLSAKLSQKLKTITDGFYALERECRFTYLNRRPSGIVPPGWPVAGQEYLA